MQTLHCFAKTVKRPRLPIQWCGAQQRRKRCRAQECGERLANVSICLRLRTIRLAVSGALATTACKYLLLLIVSSTVVAVIAEPSLQKA